MQTLMAPCVALALHTHGTLAPAASLPAKPVKIIVPSVPGIGSDILARADIAARLRVARTSGAKVD